MWSLDEVQADVAAILISTFLDLAESESMKDEIGEFYFSMFIVDSRMHACSREHWGIIQGQALSVKASASVLI